MFLARKILGKTFKHNLFGCTTVSEGSIGLRRQFGEHSGRLNPGCNCTPVCIGYTVGGFISTRFRQLQISSQSRTNDEIPIHYKALIIWTVDVDVLAELKVPKFEDKLVSKVASQCINNILGQTQWIPLLNSTAWDAPPLPLGADGDIPAPPSLDKKIQLAMQNILKESGLLVKDVFLFDITPNPSLHNSYVELSAAKTTRKMKESLIQSSKAIYPNLDEQQIANIWARKEEVDYVKQVSTASKKSLLFIGAEGVSQPTKSFIA